MTVVVLSFISSDEQITAGIPRFITIESNIPATIYFTLDGTTPDTNSPIYIDTFEMPDGHNSITLSAFGVDEFSEEGPILTQIFAPNVTKIDRVFITKNEGIVVDRSTNSINIPVEYDADGNAVSFTDLSDLDLRTMHSDKGRLGIAEGTAITIETPSPDDTPFPFDDPFQIASSPSDNFFNPYAKTITIDDRQENAIRIINRPYGSMRNVSREEWGSAELGSTDSTYVSGGFVKRFYSPKTNTMASYYFDHNSNRWVIGLQALPDIPQVFGFNQGGQPLVFQWLPYGRHSTIPV